MTQAELDALPEMGGFDRKVEIRDGRPVYVAVARPTWVLSNYATVVDAFGHGWAIGDYGGKRWKTRLPR